LIEQPDSISRVADSTRREASGAWARPWYRLHASTFFALLLAATALFLLNVPGRLETHAFAKSDPVSILNFGLGSHIEHGWPWTFLSRDSISSANTSSIIIGHGTSVWRIQERVEDFSPWVLLLDIGVGGIIAAVAVALFERRRRRRAHLWQFSIADLLVAITVFASALGYVGWQYREYQRETRAIEALIGNFQHEQNAVSGGFRFAEGGLVVWKSGLPRWITERLKVLPHSIFDRVVYAKLVPHDHTDFTLLSSFSALEALDLSGDQLLSNEILVQMGFLHRHESDGKFTNAMRQLESLARLRALYLADSHVPDAALDVIADFPAIEVLDLSGERGVRIGEPGLRHISRMKKLRFLYLKDLNRWFLRDSTVPLIAAIPTLEVLWLSSADVTDRALVHLAALANLRELNLAGTAIVGEDLTALKRISHLEHLIVRKSVEPAARKLQESMTGLKVTTE
jgi:hypothetical protein